MICAVAPLKNVTHDVLLPINVIGLTSWYV